MLPFVGNHRVETPKNTIRSYTITQTRHGLEAFFDGRYRRLELRAVVEREVKNGVVVPKELREVGVLDERRKILGPENVAANVLGPQRNRVAPAVAAVVGDFSFSPRGKKRFSSESRQVATPRCRDV